jgi:hypothetical protein
MESQESSVSESSEPQWKELACDSPSMQPIPCEQVQIPVTGSAFSPCPLGRVWKLVRLLVDSWGARRASQFCPHFP